MIHIINKLMNFQKQNNDKSCIKNVPKTAIQIQDPIYTEEIMLPQFSNELLLLEIPRNYSEMLKNKTSIQWREPNKNQKQLHFRAGPSEIQRKVLSKLSLTRENLVQINKKQRITRKNHYRNASDHPNTTQTDYKEKEISIKDSISTKSLNIKIQRQQTTRNVSSAFSHRQDKHNIQMDNYLRSINFKSEKRPSTSISKISLVTQKRFKKSDSNPRVIYPFQSKLKIKRVDQNPKILASVIAKKNKNLQKYELYDFINKLIKRRIDKK